MRHNRARKQGFTLTEIAVVMGLIGLVLGAIWSAAATVYTNQRTGQAVRQIIAVTTNMRTYANSLGSIANGTDITQLMCSAGVFPADMPCSTSLGLTTAASPWNTPVSIQGGGQGYLLWYQGLPVTSCIRLLASLATAASGNGVSNTLVGVYGVTSNGGASSFAQTVTTFPITPSVATTLCTSTNGGMASISGASIAFGFSF